MVKALEQPRQRLLVQTNARVRDHKVQTGFALFRGVGLHRQAHLAVGGELDAVVNQVEQNLLDARAIGLHPRRQGCLQGQGECQFFVRGQRAHQGLDFAQQVGQVDWSSLDGQLAGFHGRHIEDVVEQRHQVVGRAPHGAQVVGLLGIQGGIFHQAQHAQNAVERRA